MNYKYKYQSLNKNSNKKDIASAFVEAGLLLKPYHGFITETPILCSCKKGVNCKSPGKHPILSSKGVCSLLTFIETSNRKPYLSVGLATGFNPATGMKLIVIDVDNKDSVEWLRQRIPSIDKTFAIETKAGFHFYFLGDGKNYVKTVINWNDKKVDILSGKQGVLTVGSANKDVYQSFPMMPLSPAEIKTLEGAKPFIIKAKKAVKGKKTAINYDILHDAFFADSIKEGSRHNALLAVSCKELRRRANDIVSGAYTAEDHQTFLLHLAKVHLPLCDMSEVEHIALSTYKNFDIEKMSMTFDAIWNVVFKKNTKYVSNTILNILSDCYTLIVPNIDTEGEGNGNCAGSSLFSLRKHMEMKLAADGITERVVITDKQLVIFLCHLHPGMKKKETDKIIAGKRIRGRLWNINPNVMPTDTEGEGNGNCSGSIPYVSIFTQDNTITISTVEQEPKTMTKTELMAQRLMSIYNTKSIQQEPITSTAVPPVEYVKEAKVEDVKVCVPKIASSTEAPVALSAYNKTLALLESLRMPPKAYTDKVEQAFDEAGFF